MNNLPYVRDLQKILTNDFSGLLSPSDMNTILATILKVDYQSLFSFYDVQVTEQQLIEFETILKRLREDEPLAYILGKKYFFNQEFIVHPGVLIPREDTELLVELGQEFIQTHYAQKPIKIVDLGTGTGILGLALGSIAPNLDELYLTDIDATALKTASENVTNFPKIRRKVSVLKAHYLLAFKNIGLANLIVSNPPYIAQDDPMVEPSVKRYEPKTALYAGNHGLAFYQEMSKHYLELVDQNQPWMILMEFGYQQKEAIESLFTNLPVGVEIEFFKDHKGNWRAFKLYNK